MDALAAYHQVKLSPKSSLYTLFLLPAYEYLVAPMGCASSGDELNIRSDAALAGSAAMKEVDDLLLQSSSISGLTKDLEDVLTRRQKANITLSRKKVLQDPEVQNENTQINLFIGEKKGTLI